MSPRKIRSRSLSTLEKRNSHDVSSSKNNKSRTANVNGELDDVVAGSSKSNAAEPSKIKYNLRRSTITDRKNYCLLNDSFTEYKPRKSVKKLQSDSEEDQAEESLNDSNEDGFTTWGDRRKPDCLFEEQYDGKRIFQFSTPKLKDAMSALALNTPKHNSNNKKLATEVEQQNVTSPVGRGSKHNVKRIIDYDNKHINTPHHERVRLKREINKAKKLIESESDFSSDDSDDYEPELSSENDNDDADSTDETTIEEESISSIDGGPSVKSKSHHKNKTEKIVVPQTPVTRSRERSRKQSDYVLESEAYFSHSSKKKCLTSDHTLNLLKTPRLTHDDLFKLLAEMQLSEEHTRAISELQDEYQKYFTDWLYYLNGGFNIILYGLGSKQIILQKFHNELLLGQNVIVVNGFFPSLTVKDIFDNIVIEILNKQPKSGTLYEQLSMIDREFKELPGLHLFLLIHNLDGIMLRNTTAQDLLSRLANISNVHLVTTIDHINTPLLWDHTKLRNYNFCWWDTTTMLPYSMETAYENSLLVKNSGGLALSSMRNVYQSLTTNSRSIFLVVIKYQLTNRTSATYQGMPFKKLYEKCREEFLVSSDVALRSQLTEFLDHNLIKLKRNIDGTEYITIPTEQTLLQQFSDNQKE